MIFTLFSSADGKWEGEKTKKGINVIARSASLMSINQTNKICEIFVSLPLCWPATLFYDSGLTYFFIIASPRLKILAHFRFWWNWNGVSIDQIKKRQGWNLVLDQIEIRTQSWSNWFPKILIKIQIHAYSGSKIHTWVLAQI